VFTADDVVAFRARRRELQAQRELEANKPKEEKPPPKARRRGRHTRRTAHARAANRGRCGPPAAVSFLQALTSQPLCHELSGYMPYRQEFDVEYENEAEQLISQLAFTEEDSEADIGTAPPGTLATAGRR